MDRWILDRLKLSAVLLPPILIILAAFIVASCKPSPKVEFEGETVAEELEAMEGQPERYPLDALTPEQRKALESE